MNLIRSTLFAIYAAIATLLVAPLVIIAALALGGIWGYHAGRMWRLSIQWGVEHLLGGLFGPKDRLTSPGESCPQPARPGRPCPRSREGRGAGAMASGTSPMPPSRACRCTTGS